MISAGIFACGGLFATVIDSHLSISDETSFRSSSYYSFAFSIQLIWVIACSWKPEDNWGAPPFPLPFPPEVCVVLFLIGLNLNVHRASLLVKMSVLLHSCLTAFQLITNLSTNSVRKESGAAFVTSFFGGRRRTSYSAEGCAINAHETIVNIFRCKKYAHAACSTSCKVLCQIQPSRLSIKIDYFSCVTSL